jgi:hypothetical protein
MFAGLQFGLKSLGAVASQTSSAGRTYQSSRIDSTFKTASAGLNFHIDIYVPLNGTARQFMERQQGWDGEPSLTRG